MRRRGEEGLTLNELLIAMTITALIMIPLGGALFVGMRNNVATQNRINEANDAGRVSWYFESDVQNAGTVSANGTDAGAGCPAPTSPAVVTLVAQDAQSSVVYYQGTGVNQRLLYRKTCASGAVTSTRVVVHNLNGAQTGVITNDVFGKWQTVSIKLSQLRPPDASPFTTTVQASRRVS